MKNAISCAILVSVGLGMFPALAYGGKAKQAARQLCISRLGGTAEFVMLDKARGYVVCRDPKDRRNVRIPFRKPAPAEQTAKSTTPPATAQKPVVPPVVAASPPVSGDECQGCGVQTDIQRAPVPVVVQPLPPVQAPAPVEQGAVKRTPPSPPAVASTRPAQQGSQTRFDSGLLEQALRLCVKQYGPLAKVDYIDDKTWEVVCKKP